MFYSNNFKNLEEIQHCFFSRKNGNSKGIYESLNCGIGSKDDSKNVDKNLEIIAKNFKIQRSNLILMRIWVMIEAIIQSFCCIGKINIQFK